MGRRERESERYTQFVTVPETSKESSESLLNELCKETEENDRMGKARDLFKKTGTIKGTFHARMGTIKDRKKRTEDGGGVGGRGLYLSPQIHQEYTFRYRSACRTPAESRQEYLTSGKEYIEPCKTR